MNKTALRFAAMLLAFVAIDCRHEQAPQKPRERHVASAAVLTSDCATPRLAAWKFRGSAAGADCSILIVDSPMVLDDSTVEAMHYGTGTFALYDGGVLQFSRQRAFRGVAYRDRTGHVWTYGDIADADVKDLRPCR